MNEFDGTGSSTLYHETGYSNKYMLFGGYSGGITRLPFASLIILPLICDKDAPGTMYTIRVAYN